MPTNHTQRLETGDVIEVTTNSNVGDDVITALVLLATDDVVILDPCDGSTPFAVKYRELAEYRRFEVDEMDLAELTRSV